MTFKPGNIKLSTLRKILQHQECNLIRRHKGHEMWSRKDLLRPITFQDHIDPVPSFIVSQIMRTLKLTHKEIEKILKEI